MLKIWGRPTSICTQRALWTLVEANVPFELTLASATMGPNGHVSGGGPAFGHVNSPEYRSMNPHGTIPTIDDDGYILWESNAICRYLAQTYAPQLYGDDVKILAHASQWMDWTNTQLEPHLHTLVMHLVRMQEADRDPAAVEQTRRESYRSWCALTGISPKNPMLPATISRSAIFRRPAPSIAGSYSTSNGRRCRTSKRGKHESRDARASNGTSRRRKIIWPDDRVSLRPRYSAAAAALFWNSGATFSMKSLMELFATSAAIGPRRNVIMMPPTPIASILARRSATVAGDP